MTRPVGTTGGRDDAAGNGADLSPRLIERLDPLGEALRATYRADNHDTLSRDVTGLMLDLSKVPFEPHEFATLTPRPVVAPKPGWLVRIGIALRRVRTASPTTERSVRP